MSHSSPFKPRPSSALSSNTQQNLSCFPTRFSDLPVQISQHLEVHPQFVLHDGMSRSHPHRSSHSILTVAACRGRAEDRVDRGA